MGTPGTLRSLGFVKEGDGLSTSWGEVSTGRHIMPQPDISKWPCSCHLTLPMPESVSPCPCTVRVLCKRVLGDGLLLVTCFGSGMIITTSTTRCGAFTKHPAAS